MIELLKALLPEAPFVVALIIVVTVMLMFFSRQNKEQSSSLAQRDLQWQGFLERSDTVHGDRERQWMGFLKDQQEAAARLSREYHEQELAAMSNVAANLKELAKEQREYGDALAAHDKKLDLAVTTMKERTRIRER
jgi:hypothetical protein